MHTLRTYRHKVCLALLVSVLLAGNAQAAATEWPALPIACLPDRAAKWQDGKTEDKQDACHCPPTSMCPTNYYEYQDNSRAKMPMSFVLRCCTMPAPPLCPADSDKPGQVKPETGDCNIYCPAGTAHAGVRVIHAPGGSCDYTPPPPPPAACPAKWYPSFADAGMDTGSGGVYRFSNGHTEAFNTYPWGGFWSLTKNLNHFGFSLRVYSPLNWYRSHDIFGSIYAGLTDGVNNGGPDLAGVVNSLNASRLTWFGYSVALIDRLPDNFARSEITQALNNAPLIGIAPDMFQMDYEYRGSDGDEAAKLAVINQHAGAVLNQCHAVGGEYLSVEWNNFSGLNCAYLQCRYVYSSDYESCLSGDAKVTLADGTVKPVKDVIIGDTVKTADGTAKVNALNQYQSPLRVLYGINGSNALLTGDHPIRTKEGWKVISEDAAKAYAVKPGFAKTKLDVGDVLLTDKGEVKITEIKRFAKVEPVATFNIRVEGNQGFYANGIEVKGFDKMEMQYK